MAYLLENLFRNDGDKIQPIAAPTAKIAYKIPYSKLSLLMFNR